jgi:two-component system, response regulator, stage 0 sporulation protein F
MAMIPFGRQKEKGIHAREKEMAQVLIIDDKPAIRAFYEEELNSHGYEAIGIGDAALVRPAIQSLMPDLVLLDPYWHEQKGWDLLQAIKNENPNLPVMILTACDSFSEDPRIALAEGIVIKSFESDDLLSRMAEVLKANPDGIRLRGCRENTPAKGEGHGPYSGQDCGGVDLEASQGDDLQPVPAGPTEDFQGGRQEAI